MHDDLILGLLALLFMTVPILRWHATAVLFRARQYAKKNTISHGAVTERLVVALTGALGSTLIALLGLNRVTDSLLWPAGSPISLVLLTVALVGFAVPAVVWEYMYLTGKLER